MDQDKKPNGAFIGLIVIIIILVVGGIYVWQSKVKGALEEKHNAVNNSASVNSSDSIDLDTLDKDLNSTDTNAGVDASTVQ